MKISPIGHQLRYFGEHGTPCKTQRYKARMFGACV
nr:MAG TPA: hypothetical protein [Bacteriophage sp.]